MLGMTIGSASIIAVFGISRAATNGITATFASFGELPIFVTADSSQDDPARAAFHYRDVATVSAALGDRAVAAYPLWQRTYASPTVTSTTTKTSPATPATITDSLVMAEGRQIRRRRRRVGLPGLRDIAGSRRQVFWQRPGGRATTCSFKARAAKS